MPKLNIVRGFTYQHPDGYKEEIPPGSYEFEDAMANDRYVRGFSDDPLPPRFTPGSPQSAALMAAYNRSEQNVSSQEQAVGDEAAAKARFEWREANKDQVRQRPNQRPRQGEEEQRARINPDAALRHEDPLAVQPMPEGEGEQRRAQIEPGAATPGEEHAPEGAAQA